MSSLPRDFNIPKFPSPASRGIYLYIEETHGRLQSTIIIIIHMFLAVFLRLLQPLTGKTTDPFHSICSSVALVIWVWKWGVVKNGAWWDGLLDFPLYTVYPIWCSIVLRRCVESSCRGGGGWGVEQIHQSLSFFNPTITIPPPPLMDQNEKDTRSTQASISDLFLRVSSTALYCSLLKSEWALVTRYYSLILRL